MNDLAPVVAMIAVLFLGVFGIRLVRRGAERRKGVLMLVCGAVILGNILIWTL
ncbi:MAG: hypothetical protein M3R41_09270 [Pseudomonadota bacterium]|nr:hypothetical protein [Pseudomonadota bacterium]